MHRPILCAWFLLQFSACAAEEELASAEDAVTSLPPASASESHGAPGDGASTEVREAIASGTPMRTSEHDGMVIGRVEDRTAAPSPQMSIRTTDVREEGVEPIWSTLFDIEETFDIHFAFEVPSSAAGKHVVALELWMPDGVPYQRIEVEFSAGVPASDQEQQAEPTHSGYRIWASIPVSGTFIQQHELKGDWTAAAFLEGAPSPNVTQVFTLY